MSEHQAQENTIPVRYVGPRSEYEDANYGTGWWKKGEQKWVAITTAQYMLYHADVWVDARQAAARKKNPVHPAVKPPTRRAKEDDVPLANLAMMDKASLSRYAEANFQHRFDYDNTTAQQMRTRIVGLMHERQ